MIEEIVVSVLLLVGCLMSLAAGIGLLRFPDLLSRMHAATKPQVLGLLCLVMALAVHVHQWVWVPVLVLIWVLQAITAPVSAHMVGRAAYRSKHLRPQTLVQDDLAVVVAAAQEREDGEDPAHRVAGAPAADASRDADTPQDAPGAEPGHASDPEPGPDQPPRP